MTELSICCNAPEKFEGSYYYCGECFNLLDDVTFENTLTQREMKPSIRVKKFEDLIFKTKLDWFVRETLLDLFPKIERYFYDSDRINFINMSQLAREMCRVCGYSESIEKFKPLKTKMRVKQVSKFVDDAILFTFGSGVKGGLMKMEDIPMIELSCGEIDMRRVPLDEHIFSDRNSINVETNKAKAKAKVETERKGRVLLRLSRRKDV